MILGTLLTAALTVGGVQAADTTFPAGSASTLDLELGTGTVVVRGWDRNDVGVRSDRDRNRGIEIDVRQNRVSIESDMAFFGGAADIEIDVPRRFEVRIEGFALEVHVEGVDGEVDVESLSGNVTILSTRGDVQVESMGGGIRVEDSEGDLSLNSAGSSIEVLGATGELEIETVGGSIDLLDVDSDRIDAESLGGAINFEGSLAGGGMYYFSSHGGPIDLALSAGASARFALETMAGDVDADYPGMMLRSSERGSMSFVIGGGSADVEIVLASRNNVLRVPTSALIDGNKLYVHNTENGTLDVRQVDTGLSNWAHTEILSGLSLSEHIVLSTEREGLEAGVPLVADERVAP